MTFWFWFYFYEDTNRQHDMLKKLYRGEEGQWTSICKCLANCKKSPLAWSSGEIRLQKDFRTPHTQGQHLREFEKCTMILQHNIFSYNFYYLLMYVPRVYIKNLFFKNWIWFM